MEMPVFTIRGKNHRERGVDYGVQCKDTGSIGALYSVF